MAKSQSQIQERQLSPTQENHGGQAIKFRKTKQSKTN